MKLFIGQARGPCPEHAAANEGSAAAQTRSFAQPEVGHGSEHTLTEYLPFASGPAMTWPLEPPMVSSTTVSPWAGSQSGALGARLSAFKSNAAAPVWGADARTYNIMPYLNLHAPCVLSCNLLPRF